MKIKIKTCLMMYGVLAPLFSYAAFDPVSWQLTPATNPVTIQAGQHAPAVYTLTSNLPFPVVIYTMIQSSGSPLSYNDQCNLRTLTRGTSCNIHLSFDPTTAVVSTFQLVYQYNRNVIFVPALTAIASPLTYLLSGKITGLPLSINYPGAAVPFTVTYTNNGTTGLTNCFLGDAAGNNQLILEPNSVGQGEMQVLSSNCGTVNSPIALAPQSSASNSCVVNAQFKPTRVGAVTIGSLLTCHETSANPTFDSTVAGSTASLVGNFSEPNPFPSTFFTNQAPFVAVQFSNTGSVPLTNCIAGTAGGLNELTISPQSAATVTTNQPTVGTCGIPGSPVTLNPDAPPCVVYGQLTNLQSTSSATLAAQVTCDQATASTQKTFAIQAQSGGCTSASVVATLPLPTSTYLYADNMVTFQVTNTCATDAINLGTVGITATTGNATVTGTPAQPPATYDKCSNTSLAAGQSCTITASIIPSPPINPSGLTVTASVPTGGVAPATGSTTATTVQSNNQPSHHVVFVNQCPFDVWYGIANGGNNNCPGQNCQTIDPNLLTFPAGAPASAYHLSAQTAGVAPSTIDLSLSSYQNGSFWPRTGCTMQNGQFNCATGTCQTKPGSATCLSPLDGGTGPVQPQSPFTKFEATMLSTPGADGVYDVSVINGMTVPVEVKAFGPTTGNTAGTVYNCSAAGALLQPASNNALGNCSWNFNPEATMPISSINSDFYWVTPGADNACADGVNCGMSYNSYPQSNGNSPGPVNRRQGGFLGFNPLVNDAAYIANAQWGSRNLFALYGMGKEIAGQSSSSNYGTTLVSGTNIVLPGNQYPAYDVLLSIPGITNNGSLNSCYQTGNTFFAHCGGCFDWNLTLPSESCGNGSPNYQPGWNLDWTTHSISATVGNYTPFQAIAWLKQACPTAYSYQFDDPSSSFQCNQDNGTPLTTSYQVTFCPGGVSGLPAGATEGRSITPS
ncbi:Thaumatin family protein [Legionella massiliensis]|uniref:Thaumatin family protein n=1 Tax=Legionella massiliensis TaxID=1034943 RepID=A0A078KVZ2_9GAMM|nr:thaumatin family protein [Legionella massiliensis]CDZ77166.1 Thaumatin family protein [Legionella massiliensis]CEE12904.1 Thaumatin family protein [Legionella massiliensis]